MLLVDKPAGPTSHDVVARVRRAVGTRAVGHAGTLDPFATGLLIVLVGKATRLARFAEQQAKTYLATARLGFATTTDDATGDPLGEGASIEPGRVEIEAALAGFLGTSLQRPPAFSAKKVAGERSYAKARRGEAVELAAVPITVHLAELTGYRYPEVEFRMTVSAGSYLRGIARDLGEQLGTGAHLTALRREAIGSLRVADAIPLAAVGPDDMRTPLTVVSHLPRIDVTAEEAAALGHGRRLRRATALAGDEATGPVVATSETGIVIAVGHIGDGMFHPEVVLEAAG